MLRYLFHQVECMFRTNYPVETHRKYKILIKKLRQHDAVRYNQKFIIGWDLDTTRQLLTLPTARVENL